MPKKRKLKLNELNVKSFVTKLEDQSRAVKGGAEDTAPYCEPPTYTESCGGTCDTCFYGPTCATWCANTCESCVTDCTCNTCGCPDPSLDSCVAKPWLCPY